MATTVTSKGQVTIPKPVRDHLGSVPAAKWIFGERKMAASSLRRQMARGHRADSRKSAAPPARACRLTNWMALLRGEPEWTLVDSNVLL